jgi:glucokinase
MTVGWELLVVDVDQSASDGVSAVPEDIAGIDAGGTKAHMRYVNPADGTTTDLHVRSADHDSLADVFLACFRLANRTPRILVAGVAGRPRRDGSVRITNRPTWPLFRPDDFARKHSLNITIVNDMVATSAAIPLLQTSDYQLLTPKVGRPLSPANLIVSVGTGVGSALAGIDGNFTAAESGHITWQPITPIEHDYFAFLQDIYPGRSISVEQAVGGSIGFDHMYDFMRDRFIPDRYIQEHVDDYRRLHQGLGPVITGGAAAGDKCCREIMALFGGLLGQYIRNLALTGLCEADGGSIWLTSGVLQARNVCEMLMDEGTFYERFIGSGTQHADLMKLIPIYLITDKFVAVRGAFTLARQKAA